MEARPTALVLAALFTIGLGGISLSARPAPVDGPDKPKPAIATEAVMWLTTLRGAATLDLDRERLIVVTAEGEVVARAEGSSNRVFVPVEATSWLRLDGASVSLVHNHPANTGLSQDDLVLLAHPGVLRIIAVGNDGSLYEARRGPAFNPATFQRVLAREARTLNHSLWDRTAGCVTLDERITTHFAHALAIRLARLQLLEYRAVLDPDREAAWRAVRAWFVRAGL